jgi:hypothetical protein
MRSATPSSRAPLLTRRRHVADLANPVCLAGRDHGHAVRPTPPWCTCTTACGSRPSRPGCPSPSCGSRSPTAAGRAGHHRHRPPSHSGPICATPACGSAWNVGCPAAAPSSSPDKDSTSASSTPDARPHRRGRRHQRAGLRRRRRRPGRRGHPHNHQARRPVHGPQTRTTPPAARPAGNPGDLNPLPAQRPSKWATTSIMYRTVFRGRSKSPACTAHARNGDRRAGPSTPR